MWRPTEVVLFAFVITLALQLCGSEQTQSFSCYSANPSLDHVVASEPQPSSPCNTGFDIDSGEISCRIQLACGTAPGSAVEDASLSLSIDKDPSDAAEAAELMFSSNSPAGVSIQRRGTEAMVILPLHAHSCMSCGNINMTLDAHITASASEQDPTLVNNLNKMFIMMKVSLRSSGCSSTPGSARTQRLLRVSRTPTKTISITKSVSKSQSSTRTPSSTLTASVTPTFSLTNTRSVTSTTTPTLTATPTVTSTASVTPTISDSATSTPTISDTATTSPTVSDTATTSPTISDTASVTPSISETTTVSATASVTPSLLPVLSLPPSIASYALEGPYIQSMSDTSLVVMWRPKPMSASASTVAVYVGKAVGQYTLRFMSPLAGNTLDARVRLSGLAPKSKYFYTVCSMTACAPPAADMYFTTSPAYGDAQPLRMHVLGDPGQGFSVGIQGLAAAAAFMGTRPADMWLFNGDDAYDSGLDSEYSSKTLNFVGFKSYLKHMPLWTTLGNHDVASNSAGETGPYFTRFAMPRAGEAGGVPSGTAAYYSFEYGMVHVVVLDSYYSSRSVGSAMLNWLAADLAAIDASNTKWLIAMWHHPVYSKGGHDSDIEINSVELRGNALPMLEAAGLDLLINGHSHNYERSYFVRGHHGSSSTFNATAHIVQAVPPFKKPVGLTPRNGFVSIASGASQAYAIFTKTFGLRHPANIPFASTNLRGLISDLGTVVIDVNSTHIVASYVLNTGTLGDSFQIVKSA